MLQYAVTPPRATITIDDAERRNPLSNATIAEMALLVQRAAADPEVTVIVITGAGDQAFSAGGDLSGGFVDRPLEDHDSRRALADLLRALRVCGKPTVARVNGHALAGGFGLAAACDVVVAADDATFGLPEIKVGLWPMMVTAVLQRVMPHKAVLELMLTGRRITAEEAMRLGAVSRVVPRGELDAAVDLVVSGLAAASPVVTRLGRDAFYGVEDLPFDAALDRLHVGLTAVSATEDAAEGIAAFQEKRHPQWKGR
ncbi:MAG TPA: enoyl-CoA hydratase-related protein [Acidimicrobiia bacterium]|nr:enoyl-CoA hydratase-related protein [Acidimicrobiia bacterium]